MKKGLLGTTALVGASIAMIGVAEAAKVKVSVKGKFKISTAFIDQDQEGLSSSKNAVNSVSTDRGITIVSDSELQVRGQGKTDAGMNWRGTLELETDDSAGGGASTRRVADDTHLRLWGSWGMLQLGSIDGPGDKMSRNDGKFTYGTKGVNGDWPRYVNRKSVNSRFHTGPKIRDSSDSAKIVYYTPRMSGFQAGWGWAPDTGDEGAGRSGDGGGGIVTMTTSTDSGSDTTIVTTTSGTGNRDDFHEVGVNYIAKHSGVSVEASYTGSFAGQENDTRNRVESHGAHLILGYGGFKVGGGYVWDGDHSRPKTDGDDDLSAWSAGISYGKGPIGVSYAYGRSMIENTSAGADDDTQELHVVGATYKLGKGVSLHAEYFHYESEEGNSADTGDDNEADVIIIGIATAW